jgi:hypothetical protein
MRIVSAVCVACIVASAALGAQQPRPSADPIAAHKTFVLTGCLTKTGIAPTTAYKLVDAVAVGQPPPAAAEAAPVATSGQVDRATAKATYTLLPQTTPGDPGVPAEHLNTFVGQRVQVTVRGTEPASLAPQGAAVIAPTRPEEPTAMQWSVSEISRVNGECN